MFNHLGPYMPASNNWILSERGALDIHLQAYIGYTLLLSVE